MRILDKFVPVDRSQPPYLAVGFLAAGGILAVYLIYIFLNGSPSLMMVNPAYPSQTPYLPRHATSTPFQPSAGNVTPRPAVSAEAAPPEPQVGAPFFAEINLEKGADQIAVWITPFGSRFNNGLPLSLSFLPGPQCDFGDKHACTSLHEDGRYLLFTVHSGLGGEAQALRHAIEGTGINRSGKDLEDTLSSLKSLEGARVSVLQRDKRADGLVVRAAVRIPPQDMAAYFDLPFSEALQLAAELNQELKDLLGSGSAAIFIETCGWRMPGEAWAPGVNDTTGSIYLIAIGPEK